MPNLERARPMGGVDLMTQNEVMTLENMIDAHGVHGVLTALAGICCEKSYNMESEWQDYALATHWRRRANNVATFIGSMDY